MKQGMYIGIDASLTHTGIARVHAHAKRVEVLDRCVIETTPDETIGTRLSKIASGVVRVISRVNKLEGIRVGMEGFSFGDRFRQRDLGMVHGVIRLVVHRQVGELSLVTPQAVKRVACPTWYGWSTELWERAGMRGKFKRSMPPKKDIGAGLFNRYGINTTSEHEADAICVAIALCNQLDGGNDGK